MNKKRYSLLTLGLSLSLYSAYAQGIDSLDWFPHKTGDMWEYLVVWGGGIDTFRITNTQESVRGDGKILLRQYLRYINPVREEGYREYVIDTSRLEVLEPFMTGDPTRVTYVPHYRFNVKQGDKWVVYAYPIGGYEIAKVRRIYDGMIFNRSTRLMQMEYYSARDSADTTGLTRSTPLLARGFGLVIDGGGDIFNTYYLRGAVINGVLYGDTTRVVTAIGDNQTRLVAKLFQLYQNYPNPFNPSTRIRYDLPKSANVSLKIFNTLGQEVAMLVDEEKGAGYYQVRWDAALPSGVYFYRLQAGEYLATKRMILLR